MTTLLLVSGQKKRSVFSKGLISHFSKFTPINFWKHICIIISGVKQNSSGHLRFCLLPFYHFLSKSGIDDILARDQGTQRDILDSQKSYFSCFHIRINCSVKVDKFIHGLTDLRRTNKRQTINPYRHLTGVMKMIYLMTFCVWIEGRRVAELRAGGDK